MNLCVMSLFLVRIEMLPHGGSIDTPAADRTMNNGGM